MKRTHNQCLLQSLVHLAVSRSPVGLGTKASLCELESLKMSELPHIQGPLLLAEW